MEPNLPPSTSLEQDLQEVNASPPAGVEILGFSARRRAGRSASSHSPASRSPSSSVAAEAVVRSWCGASKADADLKIILIDDCSTDGTRDILQEFAAKEHVIIYPEGQPGKRRRREGKRATGDVIVQDADLEPIAGIRA
ncbi:MAG: glycosyltransferase [Gemmataceae bacterium]